MFLKLKNIILFLSLCGNFFSIYEYFKLIKKIEFLESKYQTLSNFIYNDQLLDSAINYNDIYFYGSIGTLFLLFIIFLQNSHYNVSQKLDFYQNDNIKILSDILHNTDLEKTEHIFSQLHRILINQQMIIEILEKTTNGPFIPDSASYKLAAELLHIANL